MPFAVATVFTNSGKQTAATRMTTALGRNPLKFIAGGVGATGGTRTATATDTALSSELAEGRATGTESVVTTTVTNDTYQVQGTITATGTRAIDEAATFDASTVGNMGVSATHAVINLVNGDSIQYTVKVVFA